MTLFTANYSIPYPTSGDPVHLGAAQMEALAKTVDNIMRQVSDASALDATDAATPGRIVKRDANGRAKFAAPSASTDAATKGTVDSLGTSIRTTTLGGLTFKKSTTAPPAGTSSTTVTFVV